MEQVVELLRHHIPLAAPSTREPYVGDEENLRVSIGFTPNWFHKRLGIDFSQKWHEDPEYRYETLVKMKTHLHQIFPMVDYFTPEFENGIEKTCATISGVYGIMLMTMLYGLEPVYSANGWPDVKGGLHIPKDKLANLESFNLSQNPVAKKLFAQMDHVESKWGRIHGYLNYQGILNIALKVRGNEIFMDLYDDPEFCHHFFGHIADTIKNLSKIVQEKQRKSGFYINLLSVSNCVINMIAPKQYEEFLLPHDDMLSKEYERFGMHTCNWNINSYIETLSKIKNMGYLDTGEISNLKKIKEIFPNTRRAVMIGPVELEKNSLENLKKKVIRMRDEYSPCDIILADLEDTLPDQKIIDFINLCRDVQS